MDLSQKKILAGIFYASLSVLCWSTAFPVASALLQQKSCIDPVTLTAFRFLIGGSAMLLCYTLFTRRNPAQGMTWREWRDFAFHGIFTALMSLLLFKAQSHFAREVRLACPPDTAGFFARLGFRPDPSAPSGGGEVEMLLLGDQIDLDTCKNCNRAGCPNRKDV